MTWFGATVKDVIRKIQGNDVNANELGGETYIKSLMTMRESKLKGSFPERFEDMIKLGEIRGHILVSSSKEGQTAIDATQSIVADLVDGTLYLYKNWRECRLPVDNADTALIDPDDYTVSGNVITFESGTLSKGNKITANYNTTWLNSLGLEDLKFMLIEGTALDLMDEFGVAYNPTILENMTNRQAKLDTAYERLKKGEELPLGITQLKLMYEVNPSDDSKAAKMIRFTRD